MKENYKNNLKKSEIIQTNYREWKMNSMSESGYFLIFQGFLEETLLRDLSGNALKLYIYLGINSNNFAGTVWHSNKRIATYFKKSERTIRLWMKELEDKKLIKRMRLEYDGVQYTFLLPYNSDYNFNDLRQKEGILIKSKEILYIKLKDKLYPISSGIYIEVYDDITSKWILGRIYSIKDSRWIYDNNKNINYMFKSINEQYEKKLSEGENIKIRVNI